MHITIVNPPNLPYTPKGLLIEPVDILNIANSIIEKKKHSVSIIDMEHRQILNIEHLLLSTDMLLIVFDYHIPLGNNSAIDNIKSIITHAHHYNTPVILGGKLATYAIDETLIDLNADLYICYEIENIINKLLDVDIKNLTALNNIPNIKYISNNKIINTQIDRPKIKTLNISTFNSRNLLDSSTYIDTKTILTSRGCHNKCKFCHVPDYWRNWRGNAIPTVIADIQNIYTLTKTKKILLLDDNAIVHHKRMIRLSKEIGELNLPIAFGCLGSIDRYKTNVLTEMYKAGFRWIHYGIESGDAKLLNEVNKKITIQQIKSVIAETRALGFRVRVSVILDLPGTTYESIEKTLNLLIELDVHEIRLHFLSIRNGSEYSKQFELSANQYIHNSTPTFNKSVINSSDINIKANELIHTLTQHGYTFINNPDIFNDLSQLEKMSPNYKIVSLCPIRYGLGWSK